MKNSIRIPIILFFIVYGLMNGIYGMKPFQNGNITEYFQYSLLSIISLSVAAIIYFYTDKTKE